MARGQPKKSVANKDMAYAGNLEGVREGLIAEPLVRFRQGPMCSLDKPQSGWVAAKMLSLAWPPWPPPCTPRVFFNPLLKRRFRRGVYRIFCLAIP
jgi:hypothetical protein